MRTEAEVRAEIAKWKRIQLDHSRAGRSIDAAVAALLVSGLAWVLKESESPAMRVKAA